jgi:hypothetical protein
VLVAHQSLDHRQIHAGLGHQSERDDAKQATSDQASRRNQVALRQTRAVRAIGRIASQIALSSTGDRSCAGR